MLVVSVSIKFQPACFYPKLISASKLQMQRHLDETRTANRVLELAQVPEWRE
jgi:hypothetical protein